MEILMPKHAWLMVARPVLVGAGLVDSCYEMALSVARSTSVQSWVAQKLWAEVSTT